jgi:hypothetical protein
VNLFRDNQSNFEPEGKGVITKLESTLIGWVYQTLITSALLLCLFSTNETYAQSIDRDNPTPLTTNEVRGLGIGKDVQYYYTFLAGPGEVVLTTDAAAKSGSTFFEVEVFNMDAEQLEVIRYGPTRTPERKVKRFQIAQQQPVLLRINLDTSAGTYMVRVGGAVQLDSAATLSATPVATDAAASSSTIPVVDASANVTIPSSSDGTAPVTTGETPVTTNPTTDVTATGGKVSKLQKFWMRMGAASELLGLSKIGKLKIDLKDGTSQEFGLMKVKKIFAPKSADPSGAEPGNESWQRLWMKLGNSGELMNLASTGAMRLELQDGTTQQFDLAKIKKVALKK